MSQEDILIAEIEQGLASGKKRYALARQQARTAQLHPLDRQTEEQLGDTTSRQFVFDLSLSARALSQSPQARAPIPTTVHWPRAAGNTRSLASPTADRTDKAQLLFKPSAVSSGGRYVKGREERGARSEEFDSYRRDTEVPPARYRQKTDSNAPYPQSEQWHPLPYALAGRIGGDSATRKQVVRGDDPPCLPSQKAPTISKSEPRYPKPRNLDGQNVLVLLQDLDRSRRRTQATDGHGEGFPLGAAHEILKQMSQSAAQTRKTTAVDSSGAGNTRLEGPPLGHHFQHSPTATAATSSREAVEREVLGWRPVMHTLLTTSMLDKAPSPGRRRGNPASQPIDAAGKQTTAMTGLPGSQYGRAKEEREPLSRQKQHSHGARQRIDVPHIPRSWSTPELQTEREQRDAVVRALAGSIGRRAAQTISSDKPDTVKAGFQRQTASTWQSPWAQRSPNVRKVGPAVPSQTRQDSTPGASPSSKIDTGTPGCSYADLQQMGLVPLVPLLDGGISTAPRPHLASPAPGQSSGARGTHTPRIRTIRIETQAAVPLHSPELKEVNIAQQPEATTHVVQTSTGSPLGNLERKQARLTSQDRVANCVVLPKQEADPLAAVAVLPRRSPEPGVKDDDRQPRRARAWQVSASVGHCSMNTPTTSRRSPRDGYSSESKDAIPGSGFELSARSSAPDSPRLRPSAAQEILERKARHSPPTRPRPPPASRRKSRLATSSFPDEEEEMVPAKSTGDRTADGRGGYQTDGVPTADFATSSEGSTQPSSSGQTATGVLPPPPPMSSAQRPKPPLTPASYAEHAKAAVPPPPKLTRKPSMPVGPRGAPPVQANKRKLTMPAPIPSDYPDGSDQLHSLPTGLAVTLRIVEGASGVGENPSSSPTAEQIQSPLQAWMHAEDKQKIATESGKDGPPQTSRSNPLTVPPPPSKKATPPVPKSAAPTDPPTDDQPAAASDSGLATAQTVTDRTSVRVPGADFVSKANPERLIRSGPRMSIRRLTPRLLPSAVEHEQTGAGEPNDMEQGAGFGVNDGAFAWDRLVISGESASDVASQAARPVARSDLDDGMRAIVLHNMPLGAGESGDTAAFQPGTPEVTSRLRGRSSWSQASQSSIVGSTASVLDASGLAGASKDLWLNGGLDSDEGSD